MKYVFGAETFRSFSFLFEEVCIICILESKLPFLFFAYGKEYYEYYLEQCILFQHHVLRELIKTEMFSCFHSVFSYTTDVNYLC